MMEGLFGMGDETTQLHKSVPAIPCLIPNDNNLNYSMVPTVPRADQTNSFIFPFRICGIRRFPDLLNSISIRRLH